MSKRSSKKSKRRSKAVPALGITGLSLSLASGAIASTGQAVDVPSTSQPPELFLGEEEIFDTSLSTFFTFDKENAGETSPAQMLKLAKGGCGGGCGCGGHGGGGCGGWWGCGTCWIWTPTWGWVNTCWSESTTPAEVASVPSEPVAQTAEVAVKRK